VHFPDFLSTSELIPADLVLRPSGYGGKGKLITVDNSHRGVR
jgi:hypothetical protein